VVPSTFSEEITSLLMVDDFIQYSFVPVCRSDRASRRTTIPTRHVSMIGGPFHPDDRPVAQPGVGRCADAAVAAIGMPRRPCTPRESAAASARAVAR
jgi:hypothetical protein